MTDASVTEQEEEPGASYAGTIAVITDPALYRTAVYNISVNC